MARRRKPTRRPAPFLRRVTLDAGPDGLPSDYPFTLPWLTDGFTLDFDQPMTILVGENGTGKSTLLEALAALVGFRTSGGGAWAAASDGTDSGDPGDLARRLRAGWLPKVGHGWFLRAGSFETVAAQTAGDYRFLSHGEGFTELVADRMTG